MEQVHCPPPPKKKNIGATSFHLQGSCINTCSSSIPPPGLRNYAYGISLAGGWVFYVHFHNYSIMGCLIIIIVEVGYSIISFISSLTILAGGYQRQTISTVPGLLTIHWLRFKEQTVHRMSHNISWKILDYVSTCYWCGNHTKSMWRYNVGLLQIKNKVRPWQVFWQVFSPDWYIYSFLKIIYIYCCEWANQTEKMQLCFDADCDASYISTWDLFKITTVLWETYF